MASRLVVLLIAVLAASAPVRAEDMPVFRIVFKDGEMTPQVLDVPANTRIKLDLENAGAAPVEFESDRLRKEKVLGPGVRSFLIIRNLAPGEYDFYDDFQPGKPPAKLIAK